MNPDFKSTLAASIKVAIRNLRQDGITAMSADNLRAVVRPPSGGPVGTNAAWLYAETFREVCQADRAISRFILNA